LSVNIITDLRFYDFILRLQNYKNSERNQKKRLFFLLFAKEKADM